MTNKEKFIELYKSFTSARIQNNEPVNIKEIFKECGVNLVYNTVGQGTAPSQMLDLFGLGGRTRLLSVGVLPKCGRLRNGHRDRSGRPGSHL